MGVHGLWQLLNSTGKPVPLDSLEGKVLAVDVSVWLHQLAKGMRDSAGNPVPNAHLHGLFTRICKLLYCRIKPVFVFDGAAPELKKKTLATRRNKREDAEETSAIMQKKILTSLIRSQALSEALGQQTLAKLPTLTKKGNPGAKRDTTFELPPLPDAGKLYLSHTSQEEAGGIEKRELQEMIEEEFSDLHSVDVESSDFKSLPAELQHQLIEDMRASKKNYNLSKIVELPEDSKDFSNFQMAKLLKYNKLNTRLEEVRKELNQSQTKDLGKYYQKDNYDMTIDSQRVVSDDISHFILIKGIKKKKELSRLDSVNEDKINRVESSERSSNADELLQDNSKELNSVEVTPNELMETVNASVPRHKENWKKDLEKGGIRIIEGEVNCDKDAFRPEIEIDESDSSDTDTENDEEDKMTIIGENLIDGSEGKDLQYAIEMSLKDLDGQKESERKLVVKVREKEINLMYREEENPLTEYIMSGNSSEMGDFSIDRQPNMVKEKIRMKSKGTQNRLIKTMDRRPDKETNVVTAKKMDCSTIDKLDTGQDRRTASSTVINLDTTERSVTKEGSDIEVDLSIPSRTAPILKRKKLNLLNEETSEEEAKRRKVVMTEVDNNSVVLVDTKRGIEESMDSSESDDGSFLEVKIDLSSVKEDQLFPASIFEVTEVGEVEVEGKKIDMPKPDLEIAASSQLRPCREQESEVSVTVLDCMESGSKTEEDVFEEKDADEEDDVTDSNLNCKVVEADVNQSETVKSPEVTDLVRAFKSMEESSIRDLRDTYDQETRLLQQEQSRQARMATSITDQMHADAQELLQLFGIPYIVSPSEAESQCAQLDLAKLTQGTITDDSDIWLFGGKVVFKNFFNEAKYVMCFKDVDIRGQLGLSREALINVALLCGSDYTEGIQGVGPVTALEILAEFPGEGLEGLLKLRSWWDVAQTQIKIPSESKFLSKLRSLHLSPGFPSSQVVDAYLFPQVDESSEKFTWALPDLDQLSHFANSKLGWTKEKTEELLLPVLKRLNYRQTQKPISSYFQPEVYIQPAKVESKRLLKAVNKLLNHQDSGNSHSETNKETTQVIVSSSEIKTKNGDKGKGGDQVPEKCEEMSEHGIENHTNVSKVATKGRGSKGRASRGRGAKGKGMDMIKLDSSKEQKNSDRKVEIKACSFDDSDDGDVGNLLNRRKKQNSDFKEGGKHKGLVDQERLDCDNSQIGISENSATSDSESDSDTSVSVSFYYDSDDDVSVTNTSLSVAEILGLKCGDSRFIEGEGTLDDEGTSDNKHSMRNLENGLYVEEVMRLESEYKEKRDKGLEKSDSGSNLESDCNGTRASKEETIINRESNAEISEWYKYEGSFLNEQNFSEFGETESSNRNNGDSTCTDNESVKKLDLPTGTAGSDKRVRKSALFESGKASEGHPRRKTLKKQKEDSGELSGSKGDKNKKGNSRETGCGRKRNSNALVLDTRKERNRGESEIKSNSTAQNEMKNKTDKNKIEKETKIPDSPGDKEIEKMLIHSTQPIKNIVAGVPWADHSRKKGKRGKGGGVTTSGGIKRHMEPVEKIVKRSRAANTVRNPIRCVNLSESDSEGSN